MPTLSTLERHYARMSSEELADHMAAKGEPPERYFPEEYDKLVPEDGAWIRVLDPPHTELDRRFEVEHLSMWYAMPWWGKKWPGTERRLHHAVILTPGGSLHLFPEEYQIVGDIKLWVGKEPDCVMHRLDGQPLVDEEQLFYLMSRGYPREQAYLALIDLVRSQEFAYFTMHQAYQELFEGVGTSLVRHAFRPRHAATEES